MTSYEIEIKSLLGSEEKAQELKQRLTKLDPTLKLLSQNKQLNHYFVDGDVQILYASLARFLAPEEQERLKEIVSLGSDFSIRTRLINDERLIFVIKASQDEGISHNAVSRLEFEVEVKGMTQEVLDQLLLDAGFRYQAKWSREREEYRCADINVCLDKNAGYGYLAEFEKVVENETQIQQAREELKKAMDELGAEELPQERLERMFAYYNEHWPEYYGTNKVFTVE